MRLKTALADALKISYLCVRRQRVAVSVNKDPERMGIGRGRPGRAKAVRAASRHQAAGGAAGKVPPTGGRVTPVTSPRPSRRSVGA